MYLLVRYLHTESLHYHNFPWFSNVIIPSLLPDSQCAPSVRVGILNRYLGTLSTSAYSTTVTVLINRYRTVCNFPVTSTDNGNPSIDSAPRHAVADPPASPSSSLVTAPCSSPGVVEPETALLGGPPGAGAVKLLQLRSRLRSKLINNCSLKYCRENVESMKKVLRMDRYITYVKNKKTARYRYRT